LNETAKSRAAASEVDLVNGPRDRRTWSARSSSSDLAQTYDPLCLCKGEIVVMVCARSIARP
jgi:hypothetical protein